MSPLCSRRPTPPAPRRWDRRVRLGRGRARRPEDRRGGFDARQRPSRGLVPRARRRPVRTGNLGQVQGSRPEKGLETHMPGRWTGKQTHWRVESHPASKHGETPTRCRADAAAGATMSVARPGSRSPGASLLPPRDGQWGQAGVGRWDMLGAWRRKAEADVLRAPGRPFLAVVAAGPQSALSSSLPWVQLHRPGDAVPGGGPGRAGGPLKTGRRAGHRSPQQCRHRAPRPS